MTTRGHMIINFVAFQVGWLACVVSAAQDMPMTGIMVALLVVIYYLYRADEIARSMGLVITVTLIGSAWDSLLTSLGILVFEHGVYSPYLAPVWIMVMWSLFTTTLNQSLRWLYRRPMTAALLGALGGPLAYRAGAELGAVNLPDQLLAMLVLAAGWAVLMPLLMWFAEYFDKAEKPEASAHGC